jgi:hypothetical protein
MWEGACGAARGRRDAERGEARALRKSARIVVWDGADLVKEQVKWGLGSPRRGNGRGGNGRGGCEGGSHCRSLVL